MCVIISSLLFQTACNPKKESTLFTAVEPSASGINFVNTITESDSINLITNEYTYMGGGVGIGDFNNDSLPDVFFSANQVSSKLYINKGNLKFEDITQKAGLTTNSWCTGISVVDINNDGWQDIYLCVSGPVAADKRRNLLFINNKNLTFTESAAAYGLDDDGHSTQAAFLDYDKDGLLDMFLLTHQMQGESMNKILPRVLDGSSPRNDKLYHNEGVDSVTGHPVYKNVTEAAGIRDDGYGLGIAVSDFNGDNRPDIYVSNDYIGNDCMWLNNGDGTFTNSIARSLNHQSYSSMGTDAADINNDGLPDIITLDMMPEDNQRKKMMYSILNNERHQLEKYMHYEPSFMQNTLQLNRGTASINDTLLPVFSDIAHFAGVSETDWSWSVLAADFDNDARKDLYVTNGMGKDMINSDFVAFRAAAPAGADRNKVLLEQLNALGPVPLQHYFFQNNHQYGFSNQTVAAGLAEKAISNGAAYADLDNDGDLDLVVNNINSEASLFKNNAADAKSAQSNYLSFKITGSKHNRDGLGVRIKCFIKDSVILLEQNPVRGYLSTVDKRLFTGLGQAAAVDSVQIIWPDDKMQVLKNVRSNQTIAVDYKAATLQWQEPLPKGSLFGNYTSEAGVAFTHTDPHFFDYYFQRLLPQKFSSMGPGIAVGDVNGDSLPDFFVGNGYGVKGKFFLQNNNGRFTEKTLEEAEKFEEDTGCLFFDADGDGDADLLVTSGTNEFAKGSTYYLPRLYTNDGKGNFKRNTAAIPQHLTGITCVVKSADWDGDGDLDLFLGGRIAAGAYPAPPPSYLLQNNGGIFTDVTANVCAPLSNAGMITDAAFADVDSDKTPDLIVAGEWMPVRIFKGGRQFVDITEKSGVALPSGLWRAVTAADIDGDGDMDFVAGNIGLNNKYHFNAAYPLQMWYADLDGNGSIDPVMGYYAASEEGKKELYTARSLGDLAEQVPLFKKKYLLYKDFATARMEAVFENLAPPQKLTASEGASCWFENNGAGIFKKHYLHAEAQLAPVNSILIDDYNKDGHQDILMAGNEYGADVTTGYYDAGYGLMLLGNAGKNFTAMPQLASGIFLRGDTRCLRQIIISNKLVVIAAINNAPLQMLRLQEK